MDSKALSINMNDTGEVYFIREQDVITGELSPYTKIGLVGERKQVSNSENSDEEELVDGDEAEPLQKPANNDSLDEYLKKNSLKRLKEHQTGNASRLLLSSGDVPVVRSTAVHALEAALHARFANLRVRGEWFLLNDTQRAEAIGLAKSLSKQLDDQRSLVLSSSELSQIDSTKETLQPDSELLDFNEEFKVVEREVRDLANRATEIENIIRQASLNVIELEGVGVWTYKNPYKQFKDSAAAAEVPDQAEHFMAPSRVAVLRPLKPIKGAPKIEEDKSGYAAGEAGIMMIGAREPGLEALHQEYLVILGQLNELQWKRTFFRSFLKSKFGDAKSIEGVANWERKTELKTSRALVKPHLLAIGRNDLVEKHTHQKPESYSFKVLDMRPYPLTRK